MDKKQIEKLKNEISSSLRNSWVPSSGSRWEGSLPDARVLNLLFPDAPYFAF